jgi:hypothetical protein
MLCFLCSALASLAFAQAQSNRTTSSAQTSPVSQATESVPVMDGEAGPCSVELTVTGADGKPVYAGKVKVHIAYGFGGIRRLDLEAGTNSEGKVKFTGLPARVHRPPLQFHISKDELAGDVEYDPATDCQGKHDVALQKASQPSSATGPR